MFNGREFIVGSGYVEVDIGASDSMSLSGLGKTEFDRRKKKK